MEVDLPLQHSMSPGVTINIVMMHRGYLDVGVMRKVEALNLEYIIPAKDNPKVLRFKEMEMNYCDSGFSFLVIGDNVSSAAVNPSNLTLYLSSIIPPGRGMISPITPVSM